MGILEEMGDFVKNPSLDKLAKFPILNKLVKQSQSYEKGQGIRAIRRPDGAHESIGLGFFDSYTNAGVDLLQGVEDIFNSLAKVDEKTPTARVLTRFGHRFAVGTGSRDAMRVNMTAQTLGQIQPEITMPEREFPQPEHRGASPGQRDPRARYEDD